ncbi:MAG: hypothetical protein AVDCRST_MAG11-1378, partial [uncultured Gemmatimonadaceae bacterium]
WTTGPRMARLGADTASGVIRRRRRRIQVGVARGSRPGDAGRPRVPRR